MSKTRFTPGPWVVINRSGQVFVRSEDGTLAIQDIKLADARLIAAGPDLYAAIEELLAVVIDLMPGLAKISVQDYRRVNEAPIRARAALAKALGEADR
mgnify:CR=1 FL=1